MYECEPILTSDCILLILLKSNFIKKKSISLFDQFGVLSYKLVSQKPWSINIPEEAFRGSSTGDVWVWSIVIENVL